MKRKAYFLAESLMGMALQAVLALSLMGAFYMLLTFSSSLSQTLEGYDRGQMVISYVDSRIRNAGLGLWGCNHVAGGASAPSPAGVAEAFDIASNWGALNKDYFHLPVAVTSKTGSGSEGLSLDAIDKYYEGNILTLLYAHKDAAKPDELLVIRSSDNDPVTISADQSVEKFKFISFKQNYGTKADLKTNFNLTESAPAPNNIKNWAVLEASGLPVIVSNFAESSTSNVYNFTLTAPHAHDVTVYPMSELLNLELKRMYVTGDSDNRNFVFQDPKANLNNGFDDPYYHTKDILEVYFKLTTNVDPPLLDMKVLVSDGERIESDDAVCPAEWPSGYWQSDFGKHNFHVEQAQWRLYNLTGWVFP